MAVGFHSGSGLARHNDDRAVEPITQRPADLVRIGGVQDRQRHTQGPGDDLRRQRRAAHAGEHDVVEAGALLAQRGQCRQQVAAAAVGIHPAEAYLRLRYGRLAP